MSKVHTFLKGLQAEFMANDLDAVTNRLCVPLVVYSIAGLVVLRTREDILSRLMLYREALIAQKVTRLGIEVLTEADAANNRISVRVHSAYFSEDGIKIADGLIQYYMVRGDDDLKIEMIEYIEAPLQSEDVERLIH